MPETIAECTNINLQDKRLNKRFKKSLETMLGTPSTSLPSTFRNYHQTKALYRFLDNENVSLSDIQKCQEISVYERIRENEKNKVLLAIQDTTDINYSKHKSKKELGEIQNGVPIGIKYHPTLVVAGNKIPLGILDSKFWTSDPAKKNEQKKSVKEKTKERKKKTLEEKQSYKWIESIMASIDLAKTFPEKEVINISDRESDIYELFLTVDKSGAENMKYIVRSSHPRSSKEGKKIREELYSQKPSGKISFKMKKKGLKERKVEQEILYKELILRPPMAKKILGELKTTAILAKETRESAGSEKPIEWILLTNKKINSNEEAVQIIDYYLARWDIEVFFKILKSGCKIESLQLEKKDNLSKCLAMYSIVAYQIQYLIKIGRHTPELPSDEVFSEIELKCLFAKEKKKQGIPTLAEAIKQIAKLGGYMDRKNDGPPGPQPMWIGMHRLHYMVEGYKYKLRGI